MSPVIIINPSQTTLPTHTSPSRIIASDVSYSFSSAYITRFDFTPPPVIILYISDYL